MYSFALLKGDTPSVPEDLIMSKTCFEVMIGELGRPAESKLTWYRKVAHLSALNGSTGLIMREEGADSYLI